MKTKSVHSARWLASLTLFALLVAAALPATAQTIWTNTAFNIAGVSASWSAVANWKPNTVPNGTTAIAVITNNFGQAGHTNPLITLDAAITVNSLTYADSGKSNFDGYITAGSSGTLTFDGTTPTVDCPSNGETLTISAPVIATAGLAKGTGVGNVVFSGAASGGSTFEVKGGTLNFSGGVTGFSSGTVDSGADLQIQTTTTLPPLTLNAATGNTTLYSLEFPHGNTTTYTLGSVGLTGDVIIRVYGLINSFTLGGAITSSGANSLTFRTEGGNSGNQPHTFTLNVASSYTGATTLNAVTQQGVLKLGTNNALPVTTTLTLNGGVNTNTSANFDLNGKSQTLAGLNGTPSGGGSIVYATTAGTLTISNTSDYKFSGVIGGKSKLAVSLVKEGVGTQTLSGINLYTGNTTISNGAIVGVVGGSCSNSAITISPASGTGTLGVSITNNTLQWTCASLTTSGAGTPVLDFNFGTLTPSTTTAPLNVLGKVDFTATQPAISVESTGLADTSGNGYPLLTWSGSGPIDPTGITLTLPPGVAGTLSISSSTLYLQITKPSPTQPLTWQPGTGTWDMTTSADWKDALGGNYPYVDGSDAVVFDSTGGGGTVTLNNTYSPVSVTANNASYTISGSGAIAGSTGVTKNGTGTLTLGTANTYNGTTTVSGGTLALSGVGTLGGTNSSLTMSGGTLDLGALTTPTVGAVTITAAGGSGNTITNGTLTVSSLVATNTGTATVSANVISSAGNLFMTSAGTLVLSGADSFGGTFNITNGGTVSVPNGAILNVTGNNIVGNGANNQVSTMNISGNLTNGANFFVSNLAGSTGVVYQTAGYVKCVTALAVGQAGNGTYHLWGGTLVPGNTYIGENQGGFGVLDMTNGTFTGTGTHVGRDIIDNTTGYFNQSGGTATVTTLTIGSGNHTNSTGYLNLTNCSFAAINFTTLANNNYSKAYLAFGPGSKLSLPAFPARAPFPLNSYAQLTFDGGTLSNTVTSTAYIPASFDNAYLTANGATFNVATALPITVGQSFQDAPSAGPGTLTKIGGGTLTLTNASTYTGNTTVNGGTLALQQPYLAATSTITVATNAVLELDFAVTNTVAALVLNGTNQPGGVYGSGTSAPYLTGAGKLLVSSTASTPTNISYTVSGGTLTLTWPQAYLGWYAQSNSVNVAVTNYWSDIPNSQLATNLVISLNPAQTNVFYRMRKP